MIKQSDIIAIPCIVRKDSSSEVRLFVPDFQITVHGLDFVDTIARATDIVKTLYFHALDCNTPYRIVETCDSLAEKTVNDRNAIVHMLTLDKR